MGKTVVIGNFDGVHLGHQALLRAARAGADALTVLTFTPHPRQFFRPNDPPFRLTGDALRSALLRRAGADDVVVWPFDAALSQLSATDFLDRLVAELHPARVVVGSDFAFGHHRTGTIETLHKDGRFTVMALPLVGDDGAISSSRVRESLRSGDLAGANALLGWEWEIQGTVVHGDKRGRTINVPTANIPLGDSIAPAFGVYACHMDCGDGVWRPCVANIGVRPTFAADKPLVEAHLLDFNADLYGQAVRVRPLTFLRGEMRFESIDGLKAQIARDIEQARSLFKKD